MITYSDLGKLSSFSALMSGKKATVKDVLTAERVRSSSIRLGGGLKYNWAAMPVTDPIIDALQALSDEAQLVDKYKEILSGVMMNTGEKRLVLHHLTRGNVLGASITADDEDKDQFYRDVLASIKDFSEKVRSGEIKICVLQTGI